jgi:hypothetical protein
VKRSYFSPNLSLRGAFVAALLAMPRADDNASPKQNTLDIVTHHAKVAVAMPEEDFSPTRRGHGPAALTPTDARRVAAATAPAPVPGEIDDGPLPTSARPCCRKELLQATARFDQPPDLSDRGRISREMLQWQFCWLEERHLLATVWVVWCLACFALLFSLSMTLRWPYAWDHGDEGFPDCGANLQSRASLGNAFIFTAVASLAVYCAGNVGERLKQFHWNFLLGVLASMLLTSQLVRTADLDDMSSVSKGKVGGWSLGVWAAAIVIGLGIIVATAWHFRLFWSVSPLYFSVGLAQLLAVVGGCLVLNSHVVSTPLRDRVPEDHTSTRPVDTHLHHYQWALLLACFCRFPQDRTSAVCQALLVGWMINGLALYGPDPLWTVKGWTLEPEIAAEYFAGRCMDTCG